MRVAESTRPHDCLRVCVASAFEVDVDAIAYADVASDWPTAWANVYEFVKSRGFHFAWGELDDVALAAFLADWGDTPLMWVASVLHPSFDGYAHALLYDGPELVVYPPTGKADLTAEQLQLAAVGTFVAIDPAALQLAL